MWRNLLTCCQSTSDCSEQQSPGLAKALGHSGCIPYRWRVDRLFSQETNPQPKISKNAAERLVARTDAYAKGDQST